MHPPMRTLGRPLAVFAILSLAACSHATIGGTNVADTRENREVVEVLGKYKMAAEAKDVDALMQLVSTDYFDVAIPGKGRDARDYSQLKAALQQSFEKMKTLKLEMHLRDVKVVGDQANVDYFAISRYDLVLPSGEKWFTDSDDARLKLQRQQGQWKIVSGL